MGPLRRLSPLAIYVFIATGCAEDPPDSPTASDPPVRDCEGDWAALDEFSDPLEVTGLVHAPNGDLILTGTFEGTVDFGGVAVTSAGRADGFILRLDSCGYPLAVTARGDAELNETIEHLHIDDQGNLFFVEPVTKKTGSTPAGQRLVSLDAAGEERWHVDLASLNQAYVQDIAVASDGTAVTLGRSADFANSALVRFDALGQVVYEKSLTVSPTPDVATYWSSVAVADDNRVTLVGTERVNAFETGVLRIL